LAKMTLSRIALAMTFLFLFSMIPNEGVDHFMRMTQA
jgi:hypothetical protein